MESQSIYYFLQILKYFYKFSPYYKEINEIINNININLEGERRIDKITLDIIEKFDKVYFYGYIEEFTKIVKLLFVDDLHVQNFTFKNRIFILKFFSPLLNNIEDYGYEMVNYMKRTLSEDKYNKYINFIEKMEYNDGYIDILEKIAHDISKSNYNYINIQTITSLPKYYEKNKYSYTLHKKISDMIYTLNNISKNIDKDKTIDPFGFIFDKKILNTNINSDIYIYEYNNIPIVMKTKNYITSKKCYDCGNSFNDDKCTCVFQQKKLLHEYIVGMKLNELRKEIPNFVFTYGYSNSINPFLISTNEKNKVNIGSIFKEKNNLQIYIEYISNSVDCDEYLNSNDNTVEIIDKNMRKIILNDNRIHEAYLLQMISSLLYAFEKIGYDHNDPNAKNIKIVKFDDPKPVKIKKPYIKKNGKIGFEDKYMISNILVIFFDNGLSSIKLDEYKDIIDIELLSPLFPHYHKYGHSTIEYTIIRLLKVLFLYYMEKEDNKYYSTKKDLLCFIYHIFMGDELKDESYQCVYNYISSYFHKLETWSYRPDIKYYLVDAIIKRFDSFDYMLHDQINMKYEIGSKIHINPSNKYERNIKNLYLEYYIGKYCNKSIRSTYSRKYTYIEIKNDKTLSSIFEYMNLNELINIKKSNSLNIFDIKSVKYYIKCLYWNYYGYLIYNFLNEANIDYKFITDYDIELTQHNLRYIKKLLDIETLQYIIPKSHYYICKKILSEIK